MNKLLKLTGKNWKTLFGAILIGASAIANSFGHSETSEILLRVGELLGFVGLAHKADRILQK